MSLSLISRKVAAGVSNWICRRRLGCFVPRMSTLSGAVVSDEYPRLPSKISPWLMLPSAVEGVHKFYSLAQNRVLSLNNTGESGKEELKLGFADDDDDEDYPTKLVGSSHGWLALLYTRHQDLFLMNPLSRRHIKLPPLDDKLPIPKRYFEDNPYGVVSNVILSCSPTDQLEEENCRAMIIYGPGRHLAFCCPGRSTEWTPIGDLDSKKSYSCPHPRCYDSCVYSPAEKIFFCYAAADAELEAWDLRDPHSPRKIPLDMSPGSETYVAYSSEEECDRKLLSMISKSLVVNEKSGELFLVKRFVSAYVDSNGDFISPELCWISHTEGYDDSIPYKTIDFDVHKYDTESREFRYVDHCACSLDGLAFFIGTNHSFAISASEFPELKPNSIYYTDVTVPMSDEVDFGGHDIGIFSYEDSTFSPCYYPCDAKSFKKISPYPIWYTPSPL